MRHSSPSRGGKGRQGAVVRFRQPLEALPGKRQFHRPAPVAVVVLVHGAVNLHRGLLAGKSPAKIPKPSAPWMVVEADPIDHDHDKERRVASMYYSNSKNQEVPSR
jgi:hypothetical protein